MKYNKAIQEIELLISLTSTLEHQTYLNNKLKTIKNLLQDEQKEINTKA